MSDDFAIVSIVKGMTFVLIELESLDALESVTLAGKTLTIDGLDQAWDDTFVGSYFFVRIGRGDSELESIRTRMIEGPLEDPATGSAASDLAAYLTLQDGIPGQTSKYKIIQGVEMGRRSEILVDVQLGDDGSVAKVYLSGGAVAVMEGRVTV